MRISLDRIAHATRTIDPAFRDTPRHDAKALGGRLGCRVLLKDETATPIRSFKGRGADYFVRTLADPPARLVCASAGNFGQGLAWAARSRGLACDVFAATMANPLKVERMRAMGAAVHLAGADFDAAKAAARVHAAALGAPFIEDGREVAISEGAGSLAVELLADQPALDALYVPLGNGALLGGVATWVRARSPATRIIGVCATGAPAMQLSWLRKQIVETERTTTFADGIAVRVPIPEAVDDLDGLVDDIVLVDDDETLRAMRLLRETEGHEVEPGAAVGVAAVVRDQRRLAGRTVATILTGANVTDEQRRAWYGVG